MSRYRFMPILWNLRLSDPDEDEANQRLKTINSPNCDRLFKTKPLYNEHCLACKAFYAPNINISIDEPIVASKARIGIKQYIKDKPTKWGYKLFVICDSKTGYTCDFFIHAGKSERVTDNGLTLACGTVRENCRGFPKTKENGIPRNATRGTIQWIRDRELLFVKWKDTREVTMLSMIHSACGNDTVQRKAKNQATGSFERVNVPIHCSSRCKRL
ncbi:piggyBac transposable element-derived protein 4-like [Asterias rubens]|uniref:piggyBac transposable element-derived protein 4-like n=1 Tax=Asterias rubens TaxID=7604 RepID=UPI001455A6E3|nr:piggyBac transposable element-derived protein 4-like [Asterias rubens]